jgi:biopolymer transport protein ExbB
MLQELFREFVGHMNSGGFVMWPLFFANLFLWYGLGYRFLVLGRGRKKSVRLLIKAHEKKGDRKRLKGLLDMAIHDGLEVYHTLPSRRYLRQNLDDAFYIYRQESQRYSILVKTIIIIAPLTGLLGTVIGMIETFDSLTTMSLFTQGGGIAGGISQALFTTQLGLVVAIPGLIIGRILDKRERLFNFELEQIKDILSTKEVEK